MDNVAAIFLSIMLFSFFNIDSLKFVGVFSLLIPMLGIFLMFLLYSRFFLLKNIPGALIILLPLLLLGTCYMVWAMDFLDGNSMMSLQRAMIIYTYIMSFLFFGKVGLNTFHGKRFEKYLFSIVLIILFFLLINFDMTLSLWNSNVVGIYMSMLFLILIYLSKNKVLNVTVFFLGSYIILISDSRTSLLAYVLGYLFYMCSFVIYRSKLIYYSVFSIMMFMSFFIIFITINGELDLLVDISQKVSSKNVASGRDIIWPIVFDFITKKPILGYGGGVSLSDLYYIEFSAHNLYLQMLMQVGVVGLSFLFLFYLLLWKTMFGIYRKYNNLNIRIVGSILLWIMVIQNSEITLFQNNIALSLPIFCLMSYFLGKSCHKI